MTNNQSKSSTNHSSNSGSDLKYNSESNSESNSGSNPIRLDKWLWAARFFKTRSLCKNAIANGKIHVNNERPKTSRKINIGDSIKIQQAHATKTIIILELSEHRGSAQQAQTLYQETQESIVQREKEEEMQKNLKTNYSSRPIKKPTKKTERRALSNIKKNI